MTAYPGLGTYGNAVGVVTPLAHKLSNAAMVVKQSGNLIRPGLFWGGNATIVTGKANMSYDVAAYSCATTRGATSGAVFGGNDGVLNVATTAAPGSNSRYDVIYHWHREYSLDGVDSNPVIGVIQGTAAASPTVPSLAAFPGAIELARVLVPAGVTATNTGTTITQTAPFTAMAGGVVMVRNSTELAAYAAMDGADATQLDTGVTSKRISGAWKAWSSDWISYTPTLTGLGSTGGTNAAKYKYVGGRVCVKWSFTLGSSAVITSSASFTLPFPFEWDTPRYALADGRASAYDLSATTTFELDQRRNVTDASSVSLAYYTGTATGLSSTVPFTWTAGDILAGTVWGDPS